MVNGSIIVNNGKKIIINRAYKSTTDYQAPDRFKVGVENSTPSVADTDLDYPIPISDGTVLDNGTNTLTGHNGGSATASDTTVYKTGGGESDTTAQTLNANSGSVTKFWADESIATSGTVTQYVGCWINISDANALADIKTSGTAIRIFLGSGTSDYYYFEETKTGLSTGWNWMTSGTVVSGLNTVGSPGVNTLDTFGVVIWTNNDTDIFSSGTVTYDLARQWENSDLLGTYSSGYPTIDETNFEVETRCQLLSTHAVGYDINGFGLFESGTTMMHSEDTFTAESKSNTDQFTFIIKDRLE